MAGLLKSLSNWFRGKQDEMAEKLADPARDGKFAIEDSKKKIAEFTTNIAKLVAESKRLEKLLKTAEADVAKWQRIAEAAIENIDDARAALEKKVAAAAQVQTYQSELAKNEQIIANLRDQLNKARTKVAQAESNHARLVARLEGSKVRKELAKASTEFNSGESPLAALDDLEKAVDAEEADAEAWEDLAGNSTEAVSLEEKYGAGSSSDVDAELAALMAKSGK